MSLSDDCPICLEKIEEDYIHTTECDHNFHKKCFQIFLEKNGKKCPCCRQNLNNNLLEPNTDLFSEQLNDNFFFARPLVSFRNSNSRFQLSSNFMNFIPRLPQERTSRISQERMSRISQERMETLMNEITDRLMEEGMIHERREQERREKERREQDEEAKKMEEKNRRFQKKNIKRLKKNNQQREKINQNVSKNKNRNFTFRR